MFRLALVRFDGLGVQADFGPQARLFYSIRPNHFARFGMFSRVVNPSRLLGLFLNLLPDNKLFAG